MELERDPDQSQYKDDEEEMESVEEGDGFGSEPKPTVRKPVRYDSKQSMPSIMKYAYQPDVTRALRKAAGLPDDAPVYFDDADLVYGDETVVPRCGVDDNCTFGDAVKALKKKGNKTEDKDSPEETEIWFQDMTDVTLNGDEFYETFGWIGENEENIEEAEYQGRTVKLNKPMRGDVKKFKVYVKNPKGNVVKVNFGDPDMKIKKSNPARRKSFRARHNCDSPGPKHKARYWSCKKW